MKIVNLGETATYINGSLLTPFFYRQYFKESFYEAIGKAIQGNMVIGYEYAYRLLWVLVKTYEPKTIDYHQWIQLVEIKGDDWEIPLINEIANKFDITLPKKEQQETVEESDEDVNSELAVLVQAKKIGLSLPECNLFSMQDYVDFIGLYFDEKPKKATQEDIDKLLA